MPRNSISSDDPRTKVHLAWISAFQAVAAALIAAGAQYFITVAPLKAELKELKQAKSAEPTIPLQQSEQDISKNKLPPSETFFFQQEPLFSQVLLKRKTMSESIAGRWNKECVERGTAELVRRKFRIVLSHDTAVRGERDGVHLGVECMAGYRFLWVYGVFSDVDKERGIHLWTDVRDGLIERYDGDLERGLRWQE